MAFDFRLRSGPFEGPATVESLRLCRRILTNYRIPADRLIGAAASKVRFSKDGYSPIPVGTRWLSEDANLLATVGIAEAN